MAYKQNNSYERYPNEYADSFQIYIDGNTVRKQEVSNEPRPSKKQIQKRRKKLQEVTLQKKRERTVAERARTFDFSFTFFVVFAVTVIVVFGIAAIKPVSDATKLNLEIKTMTAELFDAKKANDEFETDMNNRIDLDYVRQVAKSAGLSYPKSGQKIFAETADSDYCVQMVQLD